MSAPFRGHLDEVGESYFEHQRIAAGVGVELIGAGLACLVHALVPDFFVHRASDSVRRVQRRLIERNNGPA